MLAPRFQFLCIAFLLSTQIIQAQTLKGFTYLEEGNYHAAIQDFTQAYQKSPTYESLFGIIQVLATKTYDGYRPDSAYQLLPEAKQLFNQLSAKEQGVFNRQGYGFNDLYELSWELQQQWLEYALAQNSVEAINGFLKRTVDFKSYRNEDREKQAKIRRAEILFEQAKEGSYADLMKLYQSYKYIFVSHEAERLGVKEQYEDLAYELYFKDYDKNNVEDILRFLKRFPRFDNELDEPLSKALKNAPMIGLIDQYIINPNHLDIPKTVKTIYPYYLAEGNKKYMEGFKSKYRKYSIYYDIDQEIKLVLTRPKGNPKVNINPFISYIRKTAPRPIAYQTVLKVIKEDVENKNWDKALKFINIVKPFFGEGNNEINALSDILKAPPRFVELTKFESSINTELNEYSPVLSADGKRLFFCRYMKREFSRPYEDILSAQKLGESWIKAELLPNINDDPANTSPLSISSDGSTLIVFKNGKVLASNKTKTGWSEPDYIFDEAYRSHWQGGTSISSDGKAIIFCAERPEGYGIYNPNKKDPFKRSNIDLFVSLKDSLGNWGPPMNLGKAINTPLEDRSPFLHPDMKTLYFSSKGHGSLGDLDVYKTTRIGDSWTEWTTPVNLGKEINTTGADWGYKITTDGKQAYFSINQGGNTDLYLVSLPEEFRPEEVSTITGVVADTKGVPLEEIEIVIEDLDTQEEVATIKPDPKTGEYFVTLPSGHLYSYTINAPGYYPKANHLDLRDKEAAIEIEENITVPSIDELAENEFVLPLKNLFFDTDKFNIKSASFVELDRIAELIKSYNLPITIAGHTDNVGSANYNKTLSFNRANAARSYFINQGCDPNLIDAKGYGLSLPIASNKTAEGRAQNRRVEIRFKKQ